MFGSEILEVAVGVIFIFILVSIVCTAVREGIETWLKTRSAYLEYGIRELLHDRDGRGLAAQIYNHPLIHGLYPGEYAPRVPKGFGLFARGGDLPSYIPSRNFATALLDIAARGPVSAATSGPDVVRLTAENVRRNIRNIVNPAVQRVLLTAVDEAQGDLDRARQSVEAWFDSGMDRVSGHYKRCSQKIIFGIALFVAVALNVNTLRIAEYLYENDAARTLVVARAEQAVADSAVLAMNYRQARGALDSLALPIGWKGVRLGLPGTNTVVDTDGAGAGITRVRHRSVWDWVFAPLFGWLLTAAAATLGAPFWFDVLNKVMVIRSTVKPHEKSPEEGSEDRKRRRGSSPAADVKEEDAIPVAAAAGAAAGAAAAGAGAAASSVAARAGGSSSAVADAVAEGMDEDGGEAEADDGELDGCDVHLDYATPDEDLPPAIGGVA